MKDSQFGFPRLSGFAVFVFLAVRPFLHGAPAADWSSGPDLPTKLIRATGVFFPANGRFYAMGGRTSDAFGTEMTTPYEFNPKTNTWAFKTAPLPDNQVCNMACGVLSCGQDALHLLRGRNDRRRRHHSDQPRFPLRPCDRHD